MGKDFCYRHTKNGLIVYTVCQVKVIIKNEQLITCKINGLKNLLISLNIVLIYPL